MCANCQPSTTVPQPKINLVAGANTPVPEGRRWSDGRRWTSDIESHDFRIKSRDPITGDVTEVWCRTCGGVLPL